MWVEADCLRMCWCFQHTGQHVTSSVNYFWHLLLVFIYCIKILKWLCYNKLTYMQNIAAVAYLASSIVTHTWERVKFNEHLCECIAFVSGNLEQAVSNFVFNPSVVTWPEAINRLGWPLRMYHIIVPGWGGVHCGPSHLPSAPCPATKN